MIRCQTSLNTSRARRGKRCQTSLNTSRADAETDQEKVRSRSLRSLIGRRDLPYLLIAVPLWVAVLLDKHSTRERALGVALVAVLVTVTVTDLRHRIIPDRVTGPGAVLAIVIGLLSAPGQVPGQLIAGAGAFLALLVFAVISRGGIKGGDVKLAGVIGAVPLAVGDRRAQRRDPRRRRLLARDRRRLKRARWSCGGAPRSAHVDPVRAVPRARRPHRPVCRASLPALVTVTLGAMTLRMTTAGESHGPGLTCIIEGMPAGLMLDRDAIDGDLARRQLGHGRGGRMKIERDRAEVTGGVRHGRTLGGPIALQVNNRDYANWEERMNPWPVEAEVAEVHLPRPGHADLVGTQKYGLSDVRDILERASARETAARVAGGAVAKEFLRALGVAVHSHVLQIASVAAPRRDDLRAEDFADVDSSPVRCLDAEASRAMVAEIDRLRRANESLGGVFEVRAFGLVPGLGSHVSWQERLDGRLAQAIVSIQAIKAVSIGDGFEVAGLPGSEAHDEIFYDEQRGYHRQTNRAGGLEGGMTTGDPLVVRGSMKPLPTLTKPLRSVDIATHEPAQALRERTDSCTVPAAGVVGEAMVAFVLADAYRRKFGGDHIDDVREAVRAYVERIGWRRS